MDELARAQLALKSALSRARADGDRELASEVRELGDKLARTLGGLLRMGRIHAADNRALDAPVADAVRLLAQAIRLLGVVRLVAVDDQVYVNDVRAHTEGPSGGHDLGTELARHDAGGLTFHAAFPEAGLRSLVDAFAAPPAPRSPRASLQKSLASRGLGSLEVAGKFRYRTGGEQAGRDPGAALRRALQVVTGTWTNLSAGRLLSPLPLRRSAVEMLGAGIESPELWEVPSDAPPHALHAVQVATTALLLGKAAGLSAGMLQDLGVVALLHDIGYALAPAAGSQRLAPPLALHCGDGARLLLREKGFHEVKIRRLRAILEHHRDYLGVAGAPSALGAILRVCEDYQGFVRIHGARVPRSAILGAMTGAAGRLYHPHLPQLLVNTMGLHPPGTLLELSDGRLVRSACPARSPATFATPLARVLDPISRAPTAELLDLGGGPPVRRVLPG